VQYFDVKRDGDRLKEMLDYSKGQRKVPTIVENGRVSVGFGGS
jgi:glutaredoxin 3